MSCIGEHTSATDNNTEIKNSFSWELNSGPETLAFKTAMRRFVGGVTIITTLHENRPWGMTVSAFIPVCMEPPKLLVSVNRNTITAAEITRDGTFAVNVLSQEQLAISQHCSQQGADKFIEEFVVAPEHLPSRVAMPILCNSLTAFDCRVTATLLVNSHLVFIASVESVLAPAAKPPLLYGGGCYMHSVKFEGAVQ
ncbi:flavin reductase family protein [Phyllobacterium lublinensis]|uniref:flavin reductase family protein n=1 Tax=Phyllobacterium lublinensis TaxID=2875708 RepID=UPI001CCC3CC9|nr:flavin reductase family protein [Phyllobacterium sp. 2063]MBZ9653459.1 flavin reductase family protein [Phyllobacterium sp. 2063]